MHAPSSRHLPVVFGLCVSILPVFLWSYSQYHGAEHTHVLHPPPKASGRDEAMPPTPGPQPLSNRWQALSDTCFVFNAYLDTRQVKDNTYNPKHSKMGQWWLVIFHIGTLLELIRPSNLALSHSDQVIA